MEDFLNLLLLLDALVVGEQCSIGCFQKLIEGQGEYIKQVDHSNRIGLGLCKQRSQQATGSNDMIFIGFFLEILECVECFRAFLNLVKDDQCFLRQDLLSGDHGQQLDNAMRILICFKDGFQFIFLIKVEVNIAIIVVLPELLHQPCFAYLSCAAHNQRLALFAGLPFYKLLNRVTLQVNHSLLRG